MRGRVLGKSSTLRKNGRLMGEVQAHMCLSTTGGKKAVAMDYFGMLNMYLLKPLMNGRENRELICRQTEQSNGWTNME